MSKGVKRRKNPCTFRMILQCLAIITALIVTVPTGSFSVNATEIYHSVSTESRRIALTFDDGPHPTLTPKILNILDKYGVKATFFMVGINVKYYPDAAKEVIARGHEVGNHTFSHRHLKQLNMETMTEELLKCEDVLEELSEYRPHLFRPPEGAINSFVKDCSERGDYTMVLWSIDTRDWECKDAGQIVKNVLDRVKPGDIILMHDYIGTQSKTPEALEVLLPELLARGYVPVTVSQLLGIF